jgi:hypothetical protein
MQTRLIGVIPSNYPVCSLYNNGYIFLWSDLFAWSDYPSRRRNLSIVSA